MIWPDARQPFPWTCVCWQHTVIVLSFIIYFNTGHRCEIQPDINSTWYNLLVSIIHNNPLPEDHVGQRVELENKRHVCISEQTQPSMTLSLEEYVNGHNLLFKTGFLTFPSSLAVGSWTCEVSWDVKNTIPNKNVLQESTQNPIFLRSPVWCQRGR